jgi:hypothetical protein
VLADEAVTMDLVRAYAGQMPGAAAMAQGVNGAAVTATLCASQKGVCVVEHHSVWGFELCLLCAFLPNIRKVNVY